MRFASMSFDGSIPEAVAAYNAGDRQVALWRTHCYSRDAAEFMTKISFSETRAYVERVLGARERYRELYQDARDGGAANP